MKTDPLIIRDTSHGIVQAVDYASLGAQDNSVNFAVNMRFDKKIGRAVAREGTSLVGAQIANGQEILGLHQFILSSDTKYLLAVVNGAANSALYRLIGSDWTSESVSGVKSIKHRFLTFLDTVMILDGTNQTSSANGDTWVTTGGNLDIGNCPAGKYAIEWHDRVYVAGVSGNEDTLYYSSIPTAGAITWDGDSIDIEPFSGQGNITGLAKVPGYLLIFKERALKRWDGVSTYPDDLDIIGSSSQESIVNAGKVVMYFSAGYDESHGFYETNGVDTRKISRPIQTVIDAISSANYSSISGFSNGEYSLWSIGDITYDGIAYSNVVVLYHISTNAWTVFSYPTEFKVFSPYISGNDLKIIGGNDDGEIIELFTGDLDNITGSLNIGIQYVLQYHPQELRNRALNKDISQIVTQTKNGKGGSLSARVDETGDFKPVGVIKDDFGNELSTNLSGHTFEPKFTGISTAGTEIIGLDILSPNLTSSVKR